MNPEEPVSPDLPSDSVTRAGSKIGTIAVIAGAVLVIAGVIFYFHANGYDPDAPKCDGKVMTPGDVCMDFSGRGGGTFEEMQRQGARDHQINTWIRNVGLAGGPLLLVTGITLWVLTLRRWVAKYADSVKEDAQRKE